MVHSLFASTEDWDDQLEGFEGGWPGFFRVLRLYMSHFAGMKAAMALHMTSVEAPDLDVWRQLINGLGLAGANVGEEWALHTPERLSSVVEHIEQNDRQRYVVLRLREPGPGIALLGTWGLGSSTNVITNLYLYGDDAEPRAASSELVWKTWCRETFASENAR